MATRKLGFSLLSKAYYTRLTTDALTSAYSIYDYVPDNTAMPYIVIGEMIASRSGIIGAADTEGEENTVVIHVWSDYKGDKEVADMMNNIIQAIHATALTISGYTDVMKAMLEYSDITVDDTETAEPIRHGVLRFAHHMA